MTRQSYINSMRLTYGLADLTTSNNTNLVLAPDCITCSINKTGIPRLFKNQKDDKCQLICGNHAQNKTRVRSKYHQKGETRLKDQKSCISTAGKITRQVTTPV